MDIKEILSKVDHTLLRPEATWNQIKNICDEGIKYNTASVCIPPSFVKQAAEYVDGKIAICTVIGFPNGYNTTEVKCYEAQSAVKDGATEIDMVMFGRKIGTRGYIYSTLLTILFAVIINISMHFKLKKVDMATSLKSGE